MRTVAYAVLLVAVVGGAFGGLASCGISDQYLGSDDEDAGDAQSPEECAGQCVPRAPFGWSGPGILWAGPEDGAPDCAARGLGVGYEGHAELVAPSTCEACTCEPPTGTCGLPTLLTAYKKLMCDPSGGQMSFDAPVNWDGSCTNVNAIPAGQGIQSVAYGPLTMKEDGCKLGPPVAAKVTPAHWKTFARACVGESYPPCRKPGMFCLPTTAPPPSGLTACIFHEGDGQDCPIEYPEPRVFYQAIDDGRICTTCSCGAPTGSECSAQITAYKNPGCSGPVLLMGVTSTQSACDSGGWPAGSSLGSKSAGPVTYTPGVCEPGGGKPGGFATPGRPATFCCRP